METFWMVYGEGQRAPTYKHASQTAARQEAERLAREHKGTRFYVLEQIASVISSDVIWVN